MGKKKAGSLSGKMIVRRGPAEKTGFIIDSAPPPREASGKAAPSSQAAAQVPAQKKPELTVIGAAEPFHQKRLGTGDSGFIAGNSNGLREA